MRFLFSLIVLMSLAAIFTPAQAQEKAPISDATEGCLGCHRYATPGIVADWETSRHSLTDPAEAIKKEQRARLVSADKLPEALTGHAVGCAECHTLNTAAHKDAFEHEGVTVNVVVSPNDCSTCHPVEAKQFDRNKMSRAYGNLQGNPLFRDLMGVVNRTPLYADGDLDYDPVDAATHDDSCLQCHGTKVEVTGTATRETELGDFVVPLLSGWPNQGPGRLNPDGSRGACTTCHPRHSFLIGIARQPATCSQCHKGPDAPAYKVYDVSKHGNIYSSVKSDWNFKETPWTLGRDFTAPTCAVCHISLVVDPEGQVVAERTHQMNDRLPWRLLGLPYAHPQPKEPDTTLIKNRGGLPLPTELSGEIAAEFLIDPETIARRTAVMKRVCQGCHSIGWADGHFQRLETVIEKTNQSTKAATAIMNEAWDEGLAQGPSAGFSPFDETLERMWVQHWLFWANSTRTATAMGGADYGVFDGGRWFMSRNIGEMLDWIEFKRAAAKPAGKAPTE